jgi:Taurine catabolism dioxygenase TauD, TfdA family
VKAVDCEWGHRPPTEEERRSYLPARHKLVRRHPGSGRNALCIGSHASHIVGMAAHEGQALLAELIEFATQPQFVYRHKWQVGDLVIWDNRCTCTAPRLSPQRTMCATCAARRSSTKPRRRLSVRDNASESDGASRLAEWAALAAVAADETIDVAQARMPASPDARKPD